MAVSISLWSSNQGEIRGFLNSFYHKDFIIEDCTNRWIGDFKRPLDSIDIISALMDNDKYSGIKMYIHMENGYLHNITRDNYNDVIKGLLGIYYLSAKK